MSTGKIVHMRGRTTENRTTKSIQDWIADCRAHTPEDERKPCTAFIMVHHPTEKEIHSIRLGGSPGKSDAELAQIFLSQAQGFAERISGVQSFELMAFFGSDEPQAYKPFQITGLTEFDGLATEGADAKGALAQGMRLTESIVNGVFRQLSNVHEISQGLLKETAEENRVLRHDNRSLFELTCKMQSERENRDHERAMEELRFRRSSEERATLMRLIPALTNNILGKEVFPQSTADTALIETLLNHITPEQIQMLSQFLPPTVWGPLSARLAQIQEEKTKVQERYRELAAQSETVNPDSSDAGSM